VANKSPRGTKRVREPPLPPTPPILAKQNKYIISDFDMLQKYSQWVASGCREKACRCPFAAAVEWTVRGAVPVATHSCTSETPHSFEYLFSKKVLFISFLFHQLKYNYRL
jgi:hypothetical protein